MFYSGFTKPVFNSSAMEAEADLGEPDLCSEFHPGQQRGYIVRIFIEKIKKYFTYKTLCVGRWGHSIHVTQEQLLEVTSFCHGCPGNLTPLGLLDKLPYQMSHPDSP